MGKLGKTRDEKLSGWHRLFIVFAVVWTVVSGTLFYFNFPWHEKEYIEKEQLDDVAETINIVFGLLNKKRDAGITFTIREEETFELLNKKKVLGLPKKKGPQVSHSNKKDLTFAEFMSSSIPNLTAELCSLDNVALSKYDKEERAL